MAVTASFSGQMGSYSRIPAEFFICHTVALQRAVPLKEDEASRHLSTQRLYRNIQPLQPRFQLRTGSLPLRCVLQMHAVHKSAVSCLFSWGKDEALSQAQMKPSVKPSCILFLSFTFCACDCRRHDTCLANNHSQKLGNGFFARLQAGLQAHHLIDCKCSERQFQVPFPGVLIALTESPDLQIQTML